MTWALRPLRKSLVEDRSARTEPLPKNDLLGPQTLIDGALKEKAQIVMVEKARGSRSEYWLHLRVATPLGRIFNTSM